MASSKVISRLSSRSQRFTHNFSSLKSSLHSQAYAPARCVAPTSRLPVELSGIKSMMPLQRAVAWARWISSSSECKELDPQGGLVSRSFTANPPEHFTMKVASFSLLQKSMDRCESKDFEAGGYKWKLVLFPNGNKTSNVKDHISLYLEMAGEEAIKTTLHVMVDFKLFLLNQEKKTYLVLEDAKKKERYCFHQTIVGGLAGFDKFISLDDFIDASNGYLIDDTCEFGVEVFVYEEIRRNKLGFVSIINNAVMWKQGWQWANFSKLESYPCQYSAPFTAGDQKYCQWKLALYPKGSGDYLSVFLVLASPNALPPGSKILAGFTLRILNLNHGKSFFFK